MEEEGREGIEVDGAEFLERVDRMLLVTSDLIQMGLVNRKEIDEVRTKVRKAVANSKATVAIWVLAETLDLVCWQVEEEVKRYIESRKEEE